MPNLALANELKNNFELYYIGSENGMEKGLAEKENIKYYSVTCTKLRRSLSFSNLLIPFKLISGKNQAVKLLKKLKPDLVFSKGGYVALPVAMAAHKLKIPILTHESDLTLGLANKIAAKYSTYTLTSFPETAQSVKNGLYSGAPIRKSLFVGRDDPGAPHLQKLDGALRSSRPTTFDKTKPVILVIGGSLGAVKINEIIRENLDALLKDYNVFHICGKNNLKEISKKGYHQVEFLHNMEAAFSICDIAISRAGSNTLFELLALKIPSVLIPLSKAASRGDQILNAEYFYKKNIFEMIRQEGLTFDILKKRLDLIYKNRLNYIKNMKNSGLITGNEKIIKIICELINK